MPKTYNCVVLSKGRKRIYVPFTEGHSLDHAVMQIKKVVKFWKVTTDPAVPEEAIDHNGHVKLWTGFGNFAGKDV